MGVKNGPTHIDLFSGIGGFALAARWAGFRTVAFSEIDKYCQKVLAKNFGVVADSERGGCGRKIRKVQIDRPVIQTNGQPRDEPQSQGPHIISNIFDFDGTVYRGCDLITGGFPCQPFSVAGKRRGAADDRALWPQMFRVISEARPAWVLGENVPGIIGMELDNVLSDMEGIGYATRSFVIPACAVDARHRRDRVWVLGSNSERNTGKLAEQREHQRSCNVKGCDAHGLAAGKDMADTNGARLQERTRQCRQGILGTDSANRKGCAIWLPEPGVGRVANGVPSRVDRFKGLGNAIVPQVAYEILREIRKMLR